VASYRIISPTLWQDPEFRQLPPMAGYMLVQIRLMATNIIALYKPDWELIGELTRLDRAGRKAALAELGKPKLSGNPWALHEDGYVWVVNGFSDNGLPRRPSGDQIKAVERALAGLPRHVTLIQRFAIHYTCPDYPELDRVLTPYRQGVDTPLTHPARETGSGSGSGTGTGNGVIRAADSESPAQTDNPPAKPSDPKPTRALTVQQQAVKDCLDAFGLGYAEVFGKPYPGNLNEKAGRVAKWLKGQLLPGAVLEWIQAAQIAVKAFKLDPTFHPFPSTVPKFCEAVPKLNGAWLDSAKANAAKSSERGGSVGSHEATMTARARTCLRDNPGCGGGSEATCGYCARTVAGSKR
jgi:hypothetical protein